MTDHHIPSRSRAILAIMVGLIIILWLSMGFWKSTSSEDETGATDASTRPNSPGQEIGPGGPRLIAGVESSPTREMIFSVVNPRNLQMSEEDLDVAFAFEAVDPLNSPATLRAADAEGIAPDAPVIVVRHGEDVLGVMLSVLTRHVIVNDSVGGKPVLFYYWSPTGTLAVFDRSIELTRADGSSTSAVTFSLPGLAYGGVGLLYDRTTKGLWLPVPGVGVSGDVVGEIINTHPFERTTFARFQRAHPDGEVIVSGLGATFAQARLNTYETFSDPSTIFGLAIIMDDHLGFVPERTLHEGENTISVRGGDVRLTRSPEGFSIVAHPEGAHVVRTARFVLDALRGDRTIELMSPVSR